MFYHCNRKVTGTVGMSVCKRRSHQQSLAGTSKSSCLILLNTNTTHVSTINDPFSPVRFHYSQYFCVNIPFLLNMCLLPQGACNEVELLHQRQLLLCYLCPSSSLNDFILTATSTKLHVLTCIVTTRVKVLSV